MKAKKFICEDCKQEYVVKGYERKRDRTGRVVGSRIVFMCDCPLPWVSCISRQEYKKSTGRDVKYIFRGWKEAMKRQLRS